MSTNIILTGMMGAGKTTVGKTLSKMLEGYIFVDTDEIIKDLEGMDISEIFAKKTEIYFRNLEEQIIDELSSETNLIIALGGGAFENETNRINLSNNGKIIYLKADVDTLFERIKDDTTRPLLQCDNPKNKLKELLKTREPNYQKSDIIIETDNKNYKEITDEIISKIQE